MTARERRVVAALVDWAVAPRAPLPDVGDTDAVDAFARLLESSPAPQRLALRAALLALELLPLASRAPRPLGRLSTAERNRAFARLERGRLAAAASALARVAALVYYGDAGVQRRLGYDAAAVVARGRAIRAAEGRW